MVEPLDAIQAFHNAFRNDMQRSMLQLWTLRGERKVSPPLSSVSGSSTKHWFGMPTAKR
ncbi:MAG: hypothetical protein ACXV5I_02150 [Halobacteriota archaeon]